MSAAKTKPSGSRSAKPSTKSGGSARIRAPKNGAPARTAKSVVLLTGATGFLGKHLVEALTAAPSAGDVSHGFAGAKVRALVRHPTLHLEQRGVELVVGDVCDAAVCARAMKGVTHVVHAAGFVSRSPDDGPAMYRTHVEGTRVVLRAAAEAGVKRVVVVSTSGTIAVSLDANEVSTEASPYRKTTAARWPYYLSKIYQEETALTLGRELGLDVVVVNPSLLLGPGDERGSSTADVEKVVRGRLPVIPRGGGLAVVDVRDAAEGCLLALARGRAGERYLLSTENLEIEVLLGRVARVADVPAPRAILSPRLAQEGARWMGRLLKPLSLEPPIDAHSLEMAEHTWYCDATKAKTELGFAPRELQQTLIDTVRDIERRHNLRRNVTTGASA